MSLRIEQVTVDSADPSALAAFWEKVLGWERTFEDEVEIEIGRPGEGVPLLFLKVPDAKTVKNRLHLDLRPDDQAAEVERLTALGARRVDIGQESDVTWVVMADPEGNEFCILRAPTDAPAT